MSEKISFKITKKNIQNEKIIFLAMEHSKIDRPPALSSLWEKYKLEQERSGKAVSKGSGFSGSGYKFNDDERQMDKDRKKMQIKALGLGVSFRTFL